MLGRSNTHVAEEGVVLSMATAALGGVAAAACKPMTHRQYRRQRPLQRHQNTPGAHTLPSITSQLQPLTPLLRTLPITRPVPDETVPLPTLPTHPQSATALLTHLHLSPPRQRAESNQPPEPDILSLRLGPIRSTPLVPPIPILILVRPQSPQHPQQP